MMHDVIVSGRFETGPRPSGASRFEVQDLEEMKRRLAELKTEHRDLDDVIATLLDKAPFDPLQLQRLKQPKLLLKDEISRLASRLLPDIIACRGPAPAGAQT